MLKNRSPRYGNDEDAADDIMQRVFDLIIRRSMAGPTRKGGGVYRIDMLPTTCHVYFGGGDGSLGGRAARRAAAERASHRYRGRTAMDRTAVVRSAAKMDHLRTGGTLLNLKFTPKLLADGAGIRGDDGGAGARYFNMDGHHIQFNVVDRQILAGRPGASEAHQDLIVRVAGTAIGFNNLTL